MDTKNTSTRGKGVLKWALTLGIVIVLNLFFSVAIQTAYPEPEYQDFCTPRQVNKAPENEASCIAAGGQWNEFAKPFPQDGPQREGFCNLDFTCSQDFDDARENYTRNVFVALIVLGALSVLGGFILRYSPAVSAGLSYGGVLSFIIASIRYWGEAGDLVRLSIVGLALVALIAVGMKKFKE